MKERDTKVTHCPSTRAYLVRSTKLVRTALYSYSVITVVLGCIPFIKWEEMVEEGRKNKLDSFQVRKKDPQIQILRSRNVLDQEISNWSFD